MPLSVNLTDKSYCSIKINQLLSVNVGRINQIYFKRKSINATFLFQQLDLMKENFNLTFNFNNSLKDSFKKANYTANRFLSYFTAIPSVKWTVIDSEDLIKTNLIDCERILTNFISLLKLNTLSSELQNIIQYDSYQFIEDSTWWDQSNVAEHILTMSIPSRPSNLTYSNDFYYLHGNRPFTQYLSDNRQCYNEGIFAQMQSETITNRTSTDEPNRCLSKPFDCAFSDLYSFNDREQLYQQSNKKPLKCGFAIPSIFDKVRNRYSRNHTCQTIIFTCITNCYDPLPGVKGEILPSFCFVALLDTRTLSAYKKLYSINSSFKWDLIDLGIDATPFSVAAKSPETLKIIGQRMFPLAKWIIWIDGKGNINDISGLLKEARAPVIGAPHPDPRRTSASEVNPTIGRISMRETALSKRLNNSILDIKLQEKEYRRDGFYSRSDQLNLKMYDIAIFLYRNNHPCTVRFLCGWHNEVNYFSYRGQLSVYYPAVRLNLTDYLHFLPKRFYYTVGHRVVC
ncbi:unnamed protein product [Rotaria sp. Silwood1]|nr:unnamed protein product [Rotaria sp. Silwood1]CAF1257917.1 unnamed protein product [Rotaria sp. Silwood1]